MPEIVEPEDILRFNHSKLDLFQVPRMSADKKTLGLWSRILLFQAMENPEESWKPGDRERKEVECLVSYRCSCGAVVAIYMRNDWVDDQIVNHFSISCRGLGCVNSADNSPDSFPTALLAVENWNWKRRKEEGVKG